MKIIIVSITCLGVVNFVHGFIHCNDPSASRGKWLGVNKECAALVQSQCHRAGGAQIGLTKTWVRKALELTFDSIFHFI